MSAPIEAYGLLGDMHTAALVGRNGSIDWLCLPRIDSPACFASLLGGEDAGFWRVAPAGGGECTRRSYRGDTLILETEWDTAEGAVRVIDFMPPRGRTPDVVRIVEGLRGSVPMAMDLKLRFDYGNVVPWVHHTDGQLAAVAGPDAAWLSTEVPLHGRDFATEGRFTVRSGQRVPFVLTYSPSHLPSPTPADPERALRDTERFWQDFVAKFQYDGDWADAVRRSLIVLKALTYAPTGGIVAAATTSLPEQIGGSRNWDYRYCWLRDATFTLQALLGTGYVAEAKAWREWLLRAVAGDPADLQIMYGIDGTRRLPEYTLDWLEGYEGSGPVRIGNAASTQFQLDVWGETLDGLHLAREAGITPDDTAWDLQRALLDFLEGHWQDPDNGLWEMRGPRRHFVHSKVMAWVGMDRAVQAVDRFGHAGPVDRWRSLRARIHDEVCREGYDAERGTFTQSYGSKGLDAALLLIPRVGFLPYDDPRVVGTVEAVTQELLDGDFLLRYRTGGHEDADAGTPGDHGAGSLDGLPGSEGTFLLCSFWLADALHGIGRREEARTLFERLLETRNDLGLLSEEYDAGSRRQLGNTPQAFSHVGLVNAALHLSGKHPAAYSTRRHRTRPGGRN